MLEAREQGELVAEDGVEGEAPGADQAARGDRAVGVEDALELAVEVLDGTGAELMEQAADLDAGVGARVAATSRGHQEAAGAGAMVADGRVVGVGAAEDDAGLEGRLVEQARGRLVVARDSNTSATASRYVTTISPSAPTSGERRGSARPRHASPFGRPVSRNVTVVASPTPNRR